MRVPPILRKRLTKVAAASAVVIAGVLTSYFEGTRLKPYRDPVGIWTVCDGVTGKDVIQGKTYTVAECEVLNTKHLEIAQAGARRQIKNYDALSEWQKAALISFVYNAGEAKLATSTMRLMFNAGDIAGGCDQFMRWVFATQNGKLIKLRGLEIRRGAEAEICLEGIQ